MQARWLALLLSLCLAGRAVASEAPINLMVTQTGATQTTITWSDNDIGCTSPPSCVPSATNTGDGYLVERCTGSSGACVQTKPVDGVAADWTVISIVAAGAPKSATDTVVVGTTYTYRVRRLPYSATASITPTSTTTTTVVTTTTTTTTSTTTTTTSTTTTTGASTTTTTIAGGSAGTARWGVNIGAAGTERASAVALAANHDVVVVGSYNGTTNISGASTTSTGNDTWVARYNSSGVKLWGKVFAGTGNEDLRAVRLDTAGNAYILGTFDQSMTIGGTLVSAGARDLVLAKLDTSGGVTWSKRIGSTGDTLADGIALDGAGGLYITGEFYGTTDLGFGPLISAGGSDIYLAKYAQADGAFVWGKQIGTTSDEAAHAIAVDSGGNVLLGAAYQNTVNFGCGSLTAHSIWDTEVVKYSSAGTCIWNSTFVCSGSDIPYGIAVDGSDNVLATGTFGGGVQFGAAPAIFTLGSNDIWVWKLNSAGANQWGIRLGTAGNTTGDGPRGVAADAAGNVYVTGFIDGTIDFGAGPVPNIGDVDIFVAKRAAADGSHIWAKRAGHATFIQDVGGISVDATHVVVAGPVISSEDWGNGVVITSAGGVDGFLVSINP